MTAQQQGHSIRIDAFDPLFFRDGKPFTMGAETWADALFPPAPSVIYGALRGRYFGERVAEIPLANTEQDLSRKLTIHAIALQEGNQLLFPLPADYVRDKTISDSHKGLLLKGMADTPVSNCRLPRIMAAERGEHVETVKHGFVTASALQRYLKAASETVSFDTLDDLTVSEPKLGNRRDANTGTVEEGRLYRVDMRRLQARRKWDKEVPPPIAFFVKFSALDIPAEGFLTLGGEGRTACYAPSEARMVSAPTVTGNRFKLYLATPAIFSQGWLPSWINDRTFEVTNEFAQPGLRLEAVTLGKPVAIGGWNMVEGCPKPQRKAVPAGSVYYFRADGDVQQVAAELHGRCLADDEQDARQGFGLTFTGCVQL